MISQLQFSRMCNSRLWGQHQFHLNFGTQWLLVMLVWNVLHLCEDKVTQTWGSVFIRETKSLFKVMGVENEGCRRWWWGMSLDFSNQLFICPCFCCRVFQVRSCFLGERSLRQNFNPCCFTQATVLLLKLLTDLVSGILEPGGMCAWSACQRKEWFQKKIHLFFLCSCVPLLL